VLLILTNPYAYEKALNLAIERAAQKPDELKVVFVIDPDALDNLVRELGEKGWLGLGSQRTLHDSMLEGYRALAADILEDVRRLCAAAHISVVTEVKEAPLVAYIRIIIERDNQPILVSGSQYLATTMLTRHLTGFEDVRALVEWIQED